VTREWDPTNFTARPFPSGPMMQMYARDPDHPERVLNRFDAAMELITVFLKLFAPGLDLNDNSGLAFENFEDSTPKLSEVVEWVKSRPHAPGEHKVGADLLAEILHLGLLPEDETVFEALEIGPYLPEVEGR